MIVKNAEQDIPHCLRSAKAAVDQIVVVDTGSTDRTREVAAQCGAEVFSIPWENHFAKARNAAIGLMTTDWILVLDPDEELSPEAASEIRSLLVCDEMIAAYLFLQRNYMKADSKWVSCQTLHPWTGGLERAENASFYIDNPSIRLFRRTPQIFYSHRIHEMLDPQIYASGMKIEPSNLVIHHFGFLADAGSRQAKDYSYLELIKLAVEEEPGNGWNWMQLGMAQITLLKDADAAVQSYRRATELCIGNPDPWVCLANLHLQRNEWREAIEAASRLPGEGASGVIRQMMTGDALHGLGRLEEAHHAYTGALELARANPLNNGMGTDAFVESKLGYTQVRLGMADAGLEKLRRAVRAAPEITDNHERLVKALVLVQRNSEAAEAAESAIPYSKTESAFSRAAALHMRVGAREQARKLLDEGLKVFPDSARLCELRASIA
jgi:Flp pilus assembly protein TadD